MLLHDAFDAALDATHPCAAGGDILAAMQGATFKDGGDHANNETILGSGDSALLYRSHSGRRHLNTLDQLTLEWSGVYARYHATTMRTVIIGKPTAAQIKMSRAFTQALEACETAIRPGAPVGDV